MNFDRAALRKRWSASPAQIFPSLLDCDFGILADEIATAEKLGIEAVHWDCMDGDFVPNLSYGAPIIRSCRNKSPLYFDAHLMIQHPAKYLDDFLAAGCDGVTVHFEAADDPRPVLERIRAAGRAAGLCIKPATEPAAIQDLLPACDLVLVMSVEPGFGGQKFMPTALEKLRWLRNHAPAETLLQVDGGIKTNTAADVVRAGARLLVAGSAFYGAADRAAALADLQKVIALP